MTTSTWSSVRVNVALCGSIPRNEMESLGLSKYHSVPDLSSSSSMDQDDNLGSQLCSQLSRLDSSSSSHAPLSRVEFEAPAWAVPASGETRLEPVCDSIDRQEPIDLCHKSVFRVGRAPQSDIYLNHLTSSRRHAMLFHHANGSCYVVDCGSAHGTYVNGVRITSPPSGGVVVPHKVRRGSMIRFGGPGAPQYVLKSFNFELEEMHHVPPPCVEPESPSEAACSPMVEHNTRLNSLGKSAKATLAMHQLSSKRSFDSMETIGVDDVTMRCSSPPLSPEQNRHFPLVSPDCGGSSVGSQQPSKRRRVSFSSEPPMAFYPNLISPDLSSDETD